MISHVYVRFPDVHDTTIYHSPPTSDGPRDAWDDVDESWENLYKCKHSLQMLAHFASRY